MHYRSGISAGTNFLWEINGTKGDIVITGGLGHYQLAPVTIQYAASGNPLHYVDIPGEYKSTETTVPEQPVHGMYYAYKAVLADIINGSYNVPDFNAGVKCTKCWTKLRQQRYQSLSIRSIQLDVNMAKIITGLAK